MYQIKMDVGFLIKTVKFVVNVMEIRKRYDEVKKNRNIVYLNRFGTM